MSTANGKVQPGIGGALGLFPMPTVEKNGASHPFENRCLCPEGGRCPVVVTLPPLHVPPNTPWVYLFVPWGQPPTPVLCVSLGCVHALSFVSPSGMFICVPAPWLPLFTTARFRTGQTEPSPPSEGGGGGTVCVG